MGALEVAGVSRMIFAGALFASVVGANEIKAGRSCSVLSWTNPSPSPSTASGLNSTFLGGRPGFFLGVWPDCEDADALGAAFFVVAAFFLGVPAVGLDLFCDDVFFVAIVQIIVAHGCF